MTNYQTFKQNHYLPNLKHINYLLSSQNQQPLQQFLSSESYILLTYLNNTLKTTMETQPKKHQRFYNSILLTKNFAKNTLNLSYHQLRKALDLLKYFNLITISYYYSPITHHKTRTITLQLSNYQYFIKLLNQYKNIKSNQNHNFSEFLKPINTYLNTIYTLELEEEEDILF